MTTTPNPGSDEAIKLGCICPVIDNHHGRGFLFRSDASWRAFSYSAICPVHCRGAAVDEKRATDSKGETNE